LFSAALALLAMPITEFAAIVLGLATATIAAILPDADLRLKHRKSLHNVFAPLLLASLFALLFPDNKYIIPCMSGLLIGWLSHVLLDFLTVKGVYALYPLSGARFRLGLCKSDSITCNLLLSLVALAMIIARVGALLRAFT